MVSLVYCSSHHAEQEPSMEFIDMSVIDGGLRYVLRKQSETGEFPVTGPVHNDELLVSLLYSHGVETSVCHRVSISFVFRERETT